MAKVRNFQVKKWLETRSDQPARRAFLKVLMDELTFHLYGFAEAAGEWDDAATAAQARL